MKKTQDKTNKILLIILITLIGATIVLTTVWALFSARDKDDSQIRIGKIEVQLVEDWPEEDEPVDPNNPSEIYDEYGIKKYAKVVKGKSVGDLPAYVRIRCIPILQYYYTEPNQTEGKWITAAVPQEDITVQIAGEKWINQGDYYYYSEIVEGFGETGNLNINWTIDEIPSEIATYPIRADVKVMLEYSQTTNDMWKDVFKINSLPQGVELPAQN